MQEVGRCIPRPLTEKTRLLRFGWLAIEDRKKRGEGQSETFDFLGFTHICDKPKNGMFVVRCVTHRQAYENDNQGDTDAVTQAQARARPGNRTMVEPLKVTATTITCLATHCDWMPFAVK